MVLDYSERKPPSKNRPRKQPIGIFVIILVSTVSMSFALGLLSGWVLFRPARKTAQSQLSIASDGTKGAPVSAAPSARLQNPEASAAKMAEPPLTFYETLPKGGKAVIGSGLNPKKNEGLPVPKPAAATPASTQQASKPQPVPASPAVKPEELKAHDQEPAGQSKKAASASPDPTPQQSTAAGKFCVQIASSQVRTEAETIKARMAGKGFPVYVVESRIKDKGTWYRVKIGKHLTQQAAGELAAKVGKGALVIPE